MEWMAKREAGEGYNFTYGEPNGSSFWMDEEGKIYEEDRQGRKCLWNGRERKPAGSHSPKSTSESGGI